ncbi:hypothetical protein [Halodesulfovibrio sp. MK-HDV]|uniref:hypothetical protein n=1 Tax=Halodesulfovibrio sp. MK-HDV TaxID=2599925 RepID=UPI00136F79BD|nr:hypothetical protein [Halodesulfovibrio sp. MK-HDV]KAF1076067.1 hypothetical protein MKHDV_01503 [Halodesulfovibrio sp. MK-HDV]
MAGNKKVAKPKKLGRKRNAGGQKKYRNLALQKMSDGKSIKYFHSVEYIFYLTQLQ